MTPLLWVEKSAKSRALWGLIHTLLADLSVFQCTQEKKIWQGDQTWQGAFGDWPTCNERGAPTSPQLTATPVFLSPKSTPSVCW